MSERRIYQTPSPLKLRFSRLAGVLITARKTAFVTLVRDRTAGNKKLSAWKKETKQITTNAQLGWSWVARQENIRPESKNKTEGERNPRERRQRPKRGYGGIHSVCKSRGALSQEEFD